jgi:hypothetical protein
MLILIAFSPLGEGVKKIPGVKGASNQRSRVDAGKAQILGHETVFGENLRGDKCLDGIMLRRWTEILTDGQDVAASLAKISHDRLNLMASFSQTHHDARLGHHSRIHDLSPLQNPEGSAIVGFRT